MVVREATGEDPYRFRAVVWDVRDLRGKTAHLELRDDVASGAHAYAHVDDVVLLRDESAGAGAGESTGAGAPARGANLDPEPTPRGALAPGALMSPLPAPRVSARAPAPAPRAPIAPYTSAPLSKRVVVVPMTFPLLGRTMAGYSANFDTDRGSHRHTGQDLRAPKLHPVVAPFAGVVGFKTQTFWIVGDNGYRCLGTHLNDDTPGTDDNRADPDFMFAPNLRPGDRVAEGQLIGYVGNSGDATGPHLHFELFAPDGQLVSPVPSLRKARSLSAPMPPAGGLPAPAPLSDRFRPAKGEALLFGCPRAFDPARRILTLLVVARRGADGRLAVASAPRRVALALSAADVAAAGGADALRALPADRCCVGALVPADAPPGRAVPARRLLLP